jgi:hypothetical protein
VSDFYNQMAVQQAPGIERRPSVPSGPYNTDQRFRCLELAIKANDADPVGLAGKFYDFVTGKTVGERVAAALDRADVG